jgi:predicted ABC-type ATPase
MSQAPPVLHIFGGPNGAGKSTLFARFQETAQRPLEQVNGDVLQQQHPQLSGFEIAAITSARIRELLAARASFSIENNLATADNYKLINGAKAVGYRVELVYVSLDSVQECRFRVQQRVKEGGHDVPPAIVEQRYHQSLSLLKQHYLSFDHIRLVDNTDRAKGYQTAALIEKGRVLEMQIEPPNWAKGIVQHLQQRERLLGQQVAPNVLPLRASSEATSHQAQAQPVERRTVEAAQREKQEPQARATEVGHVPAREQLHQALAAALTTATNGSTLGAALAAKKVAVQVEKDAGGQPRLRFTLSGHTFEGTDLDSAYSVAGIATQLKANEQAQQAQQPSQPSQLVPQPAAPEPRLVDTQPPASKKQPELPQQKRRGPKLS